jgi:hypothetical protein
MESIEERVASRLETRDAGGSMANLDLEKIV